TTRENGNCDSRRFRLNSVRSDPKIAAGIAANVAGSFERVVPSSIRLTDSVVDEHRIGLWVGDQQVVPVHRHLSWQRQHTRPQDLIVKNSVRVELFNSAPAEVGYVDETLLVPDNGNRFVQPRGPIGKSNDI